MKYLLVAAVVLVAYWIWRHNREEEAREAREAREAAQRRQPPAQPAIPAQMVTCRHCGVHLPQTDATKGLLGYYCGKEHKRLAEG